MFMLKTLNEFIEETGQIKMSMANVESEGVY